MIRTGSSSRPRPASRAGGRGRGAVLATALLLGGWSWSGEPQADGAPVGRSVELSALPGWAEDDHAAALAAFRRTCRRAFPDHLCRQADLVRPADRDAARRFFEGRFVALRRAEPGFLTGYFEPEFAGALRRDATHAVALLGRPAGLVVLPPGVAPPAGWPEGLTAARRVPRGYAALPDRAAIESGELGSAARPVAYLADAVAAFTVHVQGSARLRLPDGRAVRVGFDGRNGYPYTPIARIAAEREGVAPAAMTAGRLWDWLRAHPEEAGDVMRANRSYIFFGLRPARDGEGPAGAVGVPLSAGRSLAVDPRATAYGSLVWLDGAIERPESGPAPLRRLVVAQDTGAAIDAPARGDLFVGSGDEAGREAGPIRARVGWWELRLRPAGAAPARPGP